MTPERKAELEAWRDELALELSGRFESPDAYFDTKDRHRQVCAALVGKKEHEFDPMGFWFGRMSN